MFCHQGYEINKMLAIVKIEKQGTGAVFRVNLVANCTPLERRRSSGSLILVAAQNPNRHCHNQPFLLLTTCLTARLGFNKFNGLTSLQNATREPLLARRDNAVSSLRRPYLPSVCER